MDCSERSGHAMWGVASSKGVRERCYQKKAKIGAGKAGMANPFYSSRSSNFKAVSDQFERGYSYGN